jgi:predicted GIY-YIG superfamily endonuclease
MKTFYIYMLVNPTNQEVFYVGSTLNPRARQDNHSSVSSRNNKRDQYVKNMTCKPELVIIEEVEAFTHSNVRDIEGFWIWQFKTWGFPMCNSYLVSNRKDDPRVKKLYRSGLHEHRTVG